MIGRLLLVLFATSIVSTANAQNCFSSTVAFSEPCSADAVNSFKMARANCKSGLAVTAGGLSGVCQTPNALVANIANQCANQCVTPTPTAYYSSFTSAVISYEPQTNSNLVKVTWRHKPSAPSYCNVKTYTYIAILDKVRDAAFFNSYPVPDATKFVTIKLSFSTSTTSTTTYDSLNNPTITYSSNGLLNSYSAASAPSQVCAIP